ncbi:MAG: hypothetical protein RR416_04535, partial [Clostridia bacterium]
NSTSIFQLLDGLSAKMLVIVVTHDVEEVSKYADRIVTIKDGQFVSDTAQDTAQDTALATENATAKNAQGGQNTAQDTAQNTAQPTESAQSSEPTTARMTKRCGKLSSGSVACLARSFNPYKKAKSLLLLTIMSIVMVLTLVATAFTMMTYDKAVVATLKKTPSALSIMQLKNTEQASSYYEHDLSDLQAFLATEMNVPSGKVFEMRPNFGYDFELYRAEPCDKAGNDINMFDACVFGASRSYVVLCDDLASTGVKLVSGRAPTAENECVIPLSYMQTLLIQTFRVGNDFDSFNQKYTFADEQAVFAHTFGKMKIVGVFDNIFTTADEFKKLSSLDITATVNPSNTLQRLDPKAREDASHKMSALFRNNFLSSTIMMSESNQKFIDDTCYLDSRTNDCEYQLYCALRSDIVRAFPADKQPLNFAPFNQNTARWHSKISATEINKGEIWVSSAFIKSFVNKADKSAIEVGDVVNLRLQRTKGGNKYGDPSDFKAFKVAGIYDDETPNSTLFFNEEDYQSLTGDYHVQGAGIIFDQKGLDLSDLTKIRKFCIDNHDMTKSQEKECISYIHANSTDLKDTVDSVGYIAKLFAIPAMILLIILLAFLVVNDMSNAFKFKAHELLVLKSLGAKKIDIAKVFGLFSAFVIVLELACGLGLGALAIVAVNAILLNLNGVTGAVVLTVDGGAMAIAAAIIVVVSALALTCNTLRYNDKNLRKSFQNTKK